MAGHNLFRNQLLAFRAANKHFGFRASITAKKSADQAVVGSLYFYDAIGADFFGEGITATRVVEALDQARSAGVSRLNLYINSPGGDVSEATAIHTVLDRFPGEKHAYVDGMAASAASFIALVGKTITTVPSGMWMIHNPWGMAIGDAATMRAAATDLETAREIYVAAYAKRSGTSAAKMSELMNAAEILSADEAKRYGLTDFVQAASEQDSVAPEPAHDDKEALAAAARAELRVASATAELAKHAHIPEHVLPPAWMLNASMEARLRARLQGPSAASVKTTPTIRNP